jgi:hypothetical protein
MNLQIDFETREEAAETWKSLSDSGGSGDGNGENDENDQNDPRQWNLEGVQEIPTDWRGGWRLFYFPHKVEDRRLHYIQRKIKTGGSQFLKMNGESTQVPSEPELSDIPTTESEDEARAAYQTWLDQADPEDIEKGQPPDEGDAPGSGEDGKSQWTQWTQVGREAGWTILKRDHKSENRSQWVVGSKDQAGENIYLNDAGEVVREQYLFESEEAVEAAILAYIEGVENGDVPPEDQPTGASPDPSELPGPGTRSPGSTLPVVGPAAEAVGGFGNLLLLVAVLAVAFYWAERTGRIDLLDSLGPDSSWFGGGEA